VVNRFPSSYKSLKALLKTVLFLMWLLAFIARNSLVTLQRDSLHLMFFNVYLGRKNSLWTKLLNYNLDRAHRYPSCIGTLVPDQSLSMMTSDSTAKIFDAAVCTRRSSSSVVKAASFFFFGLDTHRNRSSCPARNVSCHICGKRGNFARVSRSKGSSNDVASVAITAPVPSVHWP